MKNYFQKIFNFKATQDIFILFQESIIVHNSLIDSITNFIMMVFMVQMQVVDLKKDYLIFDFMKAFFDSAFNLVTRCQKGFQRLIFNIRKENQRN